MSVVEVIYGGESSRVEVEFWTHGNAFTWAEAAAAHRALEAAYRRRDEILAGRAEMAEAAFASDGYAR